MSSWRAAARRLLAVGVAPEEVDWDDGSAGGSLFEADDGSGYVVATRTVRIPKSFFAMAETVACHRDPERWSALYAAAFRIGVGGETRLLEVETDPLVRKLSKLGKAVRRDRHKMKAFVRFRKTGQDAETAREQFVAWFEPEHHIVELTALFFAKRFASFDWSILTPDRCAHWDGERLQFTLGVSRSEAPQDDALEDFWRTYYASIFNPARLKLKAMQAEMPKKYWKNLPEARLIAELTAGASRRQSAMVALGVNEARAHVSEKVPEGALHADTDREGMSPVDALAAGDEMSLDDLREAAACCRACPLYERATQTVFGVGNPEADIVFVGEQPGDEEDVAGEPFVGPAGRLFNQALSEAGIDRESVYITNTVKHFKWKPSEGRGRKRRLHDRANRGEVQMCKPWVLAEILKVRPRTVVALGNTAGRALLGDEFSVLAARGLVSVTPDGLAERFVATVHPSYLLRLPANQKQAAFSAFVDDLRLAAHRI
jgi:DNA polymerase